VEGVFAEVVVEGLDGRPWGGRLRARGPAPAAGAPVVEVGSGPGHVTGFLADLGADAQGIDLSPRMVDEARRRFPDGDYHVGDLRKLMRPTSAPGWSAVLAWYSLIHLAASELPDVLAALTRPLASGGWLVVALHAGAEVRHTDEWFGVPVDHDVVMHDPSDVAAMVEAVGLRDIEWYVRGPVTTRGETTERLYVVGRKP
jgi:SAM-dependent methyltransferase